MALLGFVGVVSTAAGYALSRMKFVGRKAFLSMTLVLHAFKAEMLLIAIFFVLRWLGDLPILGSFLGFNTVGGVALAHILKERAHTRANQNGVRPGPTPGRTPSLTDSEPTTTRPHEGVGGG